MEYHEIANIFPMIEGDAFKELKEDIRQNGLLEPIWTYENKILDGRNRYKACIEIGIEPKMRAYEGDDALSFVVSLNLKRRQLDKSQLAFVALKIEEVEAKRAKERLKTSTGGANPRPEPLAAQADKGQARDKSAKAIGVGKGYVSNAKKIRQQRPDLEEKIMAGKINIPQAIKEIRKEEKIKRKSTVPNNIPPITERYTLLNEDFRNSKIEAGSIDAVITDPPYPKEFIPLYKDLAEKSFEWLKPGGSLVAMCGQLYLPEVYKLLSSVEGFNYQWTLAYLMTGGTGTNWKGRVNTFWKPLIWLVKGTYGGDVMSDIVKSESADKDYHHWGQSESGMHGIIERFTDPGQTVCDPFMGGCATGAVALKMNRLFVGIEIEKESYEVSLQRIMEV